MAELTKLIGREVTAIVGTNWTQALRIPVTVLDVRLRFGVADVLVTPVLGDGEQWIELGTEYLDLGDIEISYERPKRKWDET